jgi:hypothetical protein
VGNQVSLESPLGNPFGDLSSGDGDGNGSTDGDSRDSDSIDSDSISSTRLCLGVNDDLDLETSSNVLKAGHQVRSRRSRLNMHEIGERGTVKQKELLVQELEDLEDADDVARMHSSSI